MDAEDRFAILELLARYCDVVDEKEWDRLPEVFTPDGTFDASDMKHEAQRSLPDIRVLMETIEHPHAHHVTNPTLAEVDRDTVRVHSKWLVVFADRVASGDYDDLVVRTPDGWRIKTKVARLRRPKTQPAER